MRKLYLLISSTLLTLLTCAQAPTLVADINSGTDDSDPTNLYAFDGNLYFSAEDDSSGNPLGRELYVSDGTAAGTSLVADINPGTDGSSPVNFFVYDSDLYFTAEDGTGTELWTTDGTMAGTTKIDLLPSITDESPAGGIVYILAVFLTLDANGNENQLYEWNGFDTSGNIDGNFAEDSINPASIVDVREIVDFDNGLYLYMRYSPDDVNDVGYELYKYDVAVNTYTLIADIAPGTNSSGDSLDAEISDFTAFLAELYFIADDRLYVTNGITTATTALTAGFLNVDNLFRFNDVLLFSGDNGTGEQLYSYNPDTDVLIQLSFVAGTNSDHDPKDFAFENNRVYYSGSDNLDDEHHLWRTDGVTVQQLDDTITEVENLVELNGLIYFAGENDGVTGTELFVFDPATATVEQLTGLQGIDLLENPVGENISLIGDTQTVKEYAIYDLSGKIMQRGSLKQNQIFTSLASGTYILELNDGKSNHTLKFVRK